MELHKVLSFDLSFILYTSRFLLVITFLKLTIMLMADGTQMYLLFPVNKVRKVPKRLIIFLTKLSYCLNLIPVDNYFCSVIINIKLIELLLNLLFTENYSLHQFLLKPYGKSLRLTIYSR